MTEPGDDNKERQPEESLDQVKQQLVATGRKRGALTYHEI
ncbi:MAG TPA: RNA polymerase sigma factor RpoD, partial [Alicyclobacillus sp.]|nr:RNA polymerase sigma factor RpoD [Alicyclobacillus sp.]